MKPDYKEKVSQEKLEESKSVRETLLAKWGFEPTSIWWLTEIHNKTLDALVGDTLAEGSYPTHNFNVRDGALPQSSPVVADRIIKFWSEPGDLVANPFMERIPHLLVANYLGRHVFGQDICQKFYEHDVEKVSKRIKTSEFLDSDNNKILEKSSNKFKAILNGLNFELRLGDSRKIEWPNETWDLCVNSPPYWCTIKYDDNPLQLGTGTEIGGGDSPTYEEFLKGLQDVYKECYWKLKPNKFLINILNDFRMKGNFYSYHSDVIRICQEIGFKLHDIIIYNLSLHPLQAIFTSQLARDHHTAKMHEYILCFRK